jgi:hypothetical protein
MLLEMTTPGWKLPWYYMWSPKFAVFHQIIQDTFDDPDIFLQPIFLEQEHFDKKLYQEQGQHHWKGCILKIDILLERLRLTENAGHYIVFSDADMYAREGIGAKLLTYIEEGKDMYFLQESDTKKEVNIGLILLKCTEEVCSFWEQVKTTVLLDGSHDQTVANIQLSTTDLSWGFLDQSCINSNMMNDINRHTFLYCQMLCSCRGYELDVAEKLYTYLFVISLEPYLHLIDPTIQAVIAKMAEMFKHPIPPYFIYRLP